LYLGGLGMNILLVLPIVIGGLAWVIGGVLPTEIMKHRSKTIMYLSFLAAGIIGYFIIEKNSYQITALIMAIVSFLRVILHFVTKPKKARRV